MLRQGQLDFVRERRNAAPMHRYVLTACERRLLGMIDQIDTQPAIASLRGLEGAAAAAYFEAMAEILPEMIALKKALDAIKVAIEVFKALKDLL